jgi:hypothetical protein
MAVSRRAALTDLTPSDGSHETTLRMRWRTVMLSTADLAQARVALPVPAPRAGPRTPGEPRNDPVLHRDAASGTPARAHQSKVTSLAADSRS